MDCSFEPDLTLDVWADRLMNSLEGRRYPLAASFELTERCNLSCVHCFINQSPNNRDVQERELTTKQWIEVIDQIADAGCLFLLISGGEPLLRKDFTEIFLHARHRGMIISLFSNATMLTAELADFLADNGLHSLEVSLYGATAETYEVVTGLPGSYERCLHGIELALERKIDTSLKTVLIKQNFHELQDLKALAERFGVKYRYDGLLWPRVDGGKNPTVYQIPQEDLLRLDEEDPERLEAWAEVSKLNEGQLLRSTRGLYCGAAFRSFHIDSSGNLNACMMLRNPSYNLREMPFSDAWEKLGKLRQLKRQQHTECESCEINALCQQCPGWSMQYYNDYETPVPFICELGKKRAERLCEVAI